MKPNGDDAGLLSWEKYLDLLKPASELIKDTWEPNSEQMRAELYRQYMMNLAQAYFLFFQSDPDYPDWMPLANSVFTLQPNPDDAYLYAPVNGNSVYRVVGERGSVRLLLFTTGAYFLGTTDKNPLAMGEFDVDKLKIGADGSFEIIFSSERPERHTGNWLQLDPKAEYIVVRMRSYDWGNERDPRLAIERIGGDRTSLKPRPSKEIIAANLRKLLGYSGRVSRLWLTHCNSVRNRGMVHKMEITNFAGTGLGADWPQHYWQCVYDFLPDEALILETELPQTRTYWNVQIADALFNQVEFVNRQSSLNGHQAKIDSDGKFRAVISLQDPGVPNWLDTAGHQMGMIIGRWYGCDSTPLPTVKKVTLADVRKHLPNNTPTLTATDRAKSLSLRRIGAQLRRRW